MEILIRDLRYAVRTLLQMRGVAVVAILTLALGIGAGAEIRAPMAITVIGGLTVSTLLTLVVIPVVYSLLERDAPEFDAAAAAERA